MKIHLLRKKKRIMEKQNEVFKSLSLSSRSTSRDLEDTEEGGEFKTSRSKDTIDQFALPQFDEVNRSKNDVTVSTTTTGTNTTNTNNTNAAGRDDPNRGLGVSQSDSSDFVVTTIDIANQFQHRQVRRLSNPKQRTSAGNIYVPPQTSSQSQTYSQTQTPTPTGQVDIIGILNSSAKSMSPADVFKKSPSLAPTKPPPSPKSIPLNMNNRTRSNSNSNSIPKHYNIPKSGITYNDMSTADFPTLEVKIITKASSFSSQDMLNSMKSNGSGNKSSTLSNGSVNGNSNGSINRSSTPTRSDGDSNRSAAEPVSPLTPRGNSSNKAHRRMSSSERLLKMLDEMNKKKTFDHLEYGDDVDVDDYDDDEEEEAADINHTRVVESTGSNKTARARNRPRGSSLNIRRGVIRQISVDNDRPIFSPASTLSSSYKSKADYSSMSKQHSQRGLPKKSSSKKGGSGRRAPTLHAQSFVLGIAFFAVWTQQNLMAPNLTQMAEYFHFSDSQRDLYLGANIALATGVLSLPISAMLGFLADIVQSRIKLFAGTVFFGGIAALCTGLSVTYAQLYFSRFLCGGCMAGSVVIVFSVLGDFFDAKDRNAASSAFTAMMGAGILLGQVFAGTVGDIRGWKVPFYCSGIFSMVTSVMVVIFVREPLRGGKEKVLQEMIANGTKYDRKLTMKGFIHAMTKNKTNVVLMLQGFFTNVPWGIIFTFLNDYLSQEQGLSVPVSTFLVLWFGIGSALGSICGGLIGSWCMRRNRTLLPLFMAVSTLIGIFPFLGLLDLNLTGPTFFAIFLGLSSGCIGNLPSANVRPCILNVNPPETRGAAMTANNLMVNVARGAGPSLITLSQGFFGVTRQYSFNITVS
jgi:predicted MFS family arabinose efflux permease